MNSSGRSIIPGCELGLVRITYQFYGQYQLFLRPFGLPKNTLVSFKIQRALDFFITFAFNNNGLMNNENGIIIALP